MTQPGGTVAAAVWDYGQGMEMLRVFWDEAVVLNRDAEARDERHMPLSGDGELAALFRKQGLQEIVNDALTVETRFSSFDDYWLPFLGGQGPAGAHVAGLTDAARSALEARLRARLLAGQQDRAFTLRGRAWAVRGVVAA